MLADGLRSTAAMVATDVNAIGVMSALTAAGLELPRDQAIIGFDDVDAATFVKPALSSIRQDFGALGRLAAQLLLDKLAGVDVPDGQHEAPDLVRRPRIVRLHERHRRCHVAGPRSKDGRRSPPLVGGATRPHAHR